jgi:UDP-N-acetylmuramoyl-tripeptide--D-alanyl-D-alanine ligase
MLTELYEIFRKHPKVCTDTRAVSDGAIFFALKGTTYNGNDFAEKALYDGCAYAVVDEPQVIKDERFILVNDVLETLQNLARHHRQQLQIPVIGITGSNGKTTTKELVAEVLKKKYSTYATKGNLNNHIGVPLTILSIPAETEIAVIEMGANHQKEIELLSSIARPDYGLITNIGKAHLEGFGGIEGIKKGKGELYAFVRDNGGKIFLNIDSETLVEMSAAIPAITYGSFEDCYTNGAFFAADPYVRMQWSCPTKSIENKMLESQIVGKYNYSNILAAICIGNFFDVDADSINEAIQNYQPSNNRSQILKTERNTVLLDAYNANPSSMEVAIKNFEEMQASNKVLILGDMLELGEDTETEHQQIVDLINPSEIEKVFLVGPYFQNTRCGFDKFLSATDLKYYLAKNPIHASTVLLKGSRGIKLEIVTEVL